METVQKRTKGTTMQRITIKVRAYEATLVDRAAIKIVETAKQAGAKVSGPVPLPTKRELFTILRSVHVNKKSREQFERRTHQRYIVIKDADDKLLETLKRLDIQSGVKITVEVK